MKPLCCWPLSSPPPGSCRGHYCQSHPGPDGTVNKMSLQNEWVGVTNRQHEMEKRALSGLLVLILRTVWRIGDETVPRECCDLLFPSLTCPGDLAQYTDFLLRVHVSPPDTKLPPCQAITPPPERKAVHPRSLQIGT